MDPLISIRDLKIAFRVGRDQVAEAVRGVSFDIPENATVALVGESGSGKSVTAMSIPRLLPGNALVGADSRIEYRGRDLLREPDAAMRAIRGKEISVVFQEPMTSLNPVLTVGDQIAEVLVLHLGLGRRAATARAIELLAEVGIPDSGARVNAYPHELSGGQQQRVVIAMAIACEPRLLIADEPTTALDVTVQRQILDLIAKLRAAHRMSVLFISHDLGVVGEIADHVIVMRDGTVREQGPVERIFIAPGDAYTKALLACRPRVDVRLHRLAVIDDFLRPPALSVHDAHGPAAGAVPPAGATIVERAARVLAPPPAQRPVRPADGPPLIEASGLRKTFALRTGWLARRTVEALKDVSFTLGKGRTLGVVGESGSGKTTLGLLLMRLIDATAGEVKFDGVDLMKLDERGMMAYRRRIQVVFQNPYASLNPRFTIGRILTEPMRIHRIGESDDERHARAVALVERVGLPRDAIRKYPHEFSGGQRQRIAIARCLSVQPEVLICDESVSALDVSVQATVLNLLLDLQDEFGMSYVFISHDLAVIRTMADEVLVMHQGEVVERGGGEALYEAPGHPYTRKLLQSIPKGFSARPRP